jgi:hypothetical protein
MSFTVDNLTEIWVTGTNATAAYSGWQDISSKILVRDNSGRVTITRGMGSETSNRASTSTFTGQINNRLGNFSDQNPTGIYYGLIGHNTKIRHSKRYAYDAFGRTSANGWGTADSGQAWTTNGGAAGDYSVSGGTGNISNASVNVIREIILNPVSGTGLLDGMIAATLKPGVVATGNSIQMSLEMRRADANNYLFAVASFDTSGFVSLLIGARVAGVITAIGSTSNTLTYGATDNFRLEFSVTGGQYVARIWNTATPNTQIWTYADDSTTAGAAISAAGSVACRSILVTGNTNVSPTTKFDDLVVQDIRFSGEVPDWPNEWDLTGTDIWVPFTASGRIRRLQQGNKRLSSVMTRATAAAGPIDFWPCEDTSGATRAANAVEGGQPLLVNGAIPSFGAMTAPGTAGGFTLGTDTGLRAAVQSSSSTVLSVQFLINVPAAPASASRIVSLEMSGGTYWLIVLTLFPAGGVDTWGVEIFDGGGVRQVFSSVAFSINAIDEPYGRDLYITLDLRQNGGNVEFEYRAYDYTQGAASGSTGSYAGTLGRVGQLVICNPGQVGPGSGVKYSQIGVFPFSSQFATWSNSSSYDPTSYINGFTGEDPVARLIRLCAENGVDLVTQGDSVTRGVRMGAQTPDTLYNLLHECVDVDQGFLYETRCQLGLSYRAAMSLYNQAAVTLDYAQFQLSGKLPSKTDDQYLRNDVTVARKGGSSARAVDMGELGSRLSVSEPPSGVGTYDRGTVTVNCETDNTLSVLAGWLLGLGTVDEPRYPGVQVELHRSAISTALGQQLSGLDTGDYLVINNPPMWLPQFPIECLDLGCVETLSHFTQTMVFVTRHGAPYRVLTVDGAGNAGRTDIDNVTLTADITSSATSCQATITGTGPLITTADTPFDIDLGGERVSVTAVAGAASPQTLTITRSVNGVVKAQKAGTAIKLWRPYRNGY